MAELHCGPCDQNHTFTPGEIERLVYALAAEIRAVADSPRPGDPEPVLCLEELVTLSLELDGQREPVDAAVEARRAFDRQYGGRRG